MTTEPIKPAVDAKRLRELLAKATGRPWTSDVWTVNSPDAPDWPLGEFDADEDAELCARAVNAIGPLLDANEKLVEACKTALHAMRTGNSEVSAVEKLTAALAAVEGKKP